MKYGSNTQPNNYSQDYNNNNNNSSYNNFKNNASTNRNQGTASNANRHNNFYGNPTQKQNIQQQQQQQQQQPQQQFFNTNNPSNNNLTKQYSQNENYTNANSQRINNNRAKPSLNHTNSLDHSYQYFNSQYHNNSQNFNQPPPPTPPFLAQPTGSVPPPSVQNRHHTSFFPHANSNNTFNNKTPYNLSNLSGNSQFNSQPIQHHPLPMGIATQIKSNQANNFKTQTSLINANAFPVQNPSVSPGSSSNSGIKDSSNASSETTTNFISMNKTLSGDSIKSLGFAINYDKTIETNEATTSSTGNFNLACDEGDINDESNEKSNSSTDENSQLASPSSPLKSSNSREEESDDEISDRLEAVRLPSPTDDTFDSKYPLHTTWTFWYFKHDTTAKDWESNLKHLMDVSYVDDFWSVLNNVFFHDGFKKNCDFMLFKKGILPMWEDEKNKNGGSWLYHMNQQQHNKINPNDYINKNLDPMINCWILTLLEVIGDNFCGGDIPFEKDSDQFGDHICEYISGVYLSNRKAKKVSLWTRDYKNEKMTRHIGKTWKNLLKLSEYVTITFEAHEFKYGSSNNNNNKQILYKE